MKLFGDPKTNAAKATRDIVHNFLAKTLIL